MDMKKPSFTTFLKWSSGWTVGLPRWIWLVGTPLFSIVRSGNIIDLIVSEILCFAVLAIWYVIWDGKPMPKYKSFRLGPQKDEEDEPK